MASAPPPAPLVPPFGPLAGVRVIDSGRLVAGPWAAGYLAGFGAEVVHVESPPFAPPYADPTRTLPPLLPDRTGRGPGVSESWVQYARNKLSIGLDLRNPEGRAVFLDLLRASEIWIESSRPGTYEKLGLDDATVRAAAPALTVVHISGFGRTGDPERLRAPSFDLIAQAYSGFLSLQGEPDPAPPARSGTALNDTVTGLAGAGAAVMGLLSARRTGVGQVVDVAQYEVFFQLLENLALDYFARGVVRGRHGRSHPRLYPYDLYRSRDGWVVVAAPTPESWRRLARYAGLDRPEWTDPERRRADRAEIDARLTALCAARTGAELEQEARAQDVALAVVRNIAELSEDPHYRARGMFLEWEDPVAGPVTGAGLVPRFEGTPGRVWRGAPVLGQDTVPILQQILGYDDARVRALLATGAAGSESRPLPPAPTSDPGGP